MSHTVWGHFDLDLWNISYIVGDRNLKFSEWIYLVVAECQTLFLDHCDLHLWSQYVNLLSLGAFLSHGDTIHVYA